MGNLSNCSAAFGHEIVTQINLKCSCLSQSSLILMYTLPGSWPGWRSANVNTHWFAGTQISLTTRGSVCIDILPSHPLHICTFINDISTDIQAHCTAVTQRDKEWNFRELSQPKKSSVSFCLPHVYPHPPYVTIHNTHTKLGCTNLIWSKLARTKYYISQKHSLGRHQIALSFGEMDLPDPLISWKDLSGLVYYMHVSWHSSYISQPWQR